jgi:hypothetical protein
MDFAPDDFVRRYRLVANDPRMAKKLGDRLADLRRNRAYASFMQATRAHGRQATRDGNRDKFLKILSELRVSDPPKKYEAKFRDALVLFSFLYKIIEEYLKTSDDAWALYQMGASYNFTYNGVTVNTSAVIADFRKYRDKVLPAIHQRYTLEASTDPVDGAQLAQMELIEGIGHA